MSIDEALLKWAANLNGDTEMEMYVLIVAFYRTVMPTLMPATIEESRDFSITLEYLPCGVSKSEEKLEERAKELKERFSSTFCDYNIVLVQEF